MMLSLFVNQFISSWAIYLRCHKQEPFLINSICAGFLSCLSTLLMGKYSDVLGVTSGYCLITILLLPWGYSIYKTKNRNGMENKQPLLSICIPTYNRAEYLEGALKILLQTLRLIVG